MENIELFSDFAEQLGFETKRNVPLKSYTTFKTGGEASLLVFPDDEKKLSEYIKFLKEQNIKPFVLGNGSNLLVSDNGFDGIVISTEKLNNVEMLDNNTLKCGAGFSLMKLCRLCLEKSLSGLEFAFGIPGSVGGAVYMNAGAYGGEMKDVVTRVYHIDPDGNLGFFEADRLELSYRHSVYTAKGYIITSACVCLQKDDAEKIKIRMNDYLSRRKEKQPLEYPSAGSTFKRPEGYYAGALIEKCGLKGVSVGGAQVSEKHAGFIINRNNATAADISELISLVQKTVLEKTGVALETEVIKVGE